MNEISPVLSQIPPQIPGAVPLIQSLLPLGQNPEDRELIPHPVAAVEAMLRQPRRIMYQLRQPGSGRLILGMLVVTILSSLLYGFVVGSFSMGTQLWAAPVKIVGGLLISALICLPSLYLFTCLSGSRAGLTESCGWVVGLLMLMTLLLIGFAPVAWLFSQSTQSVVWMGALHLAFWFVATCFGLRFLRAGFSHSQARATAGLHAWVVIFVLVVVQMTTALRPIVGSAETFFPAEKKLFATYWGECLNSLGQGH